MISSVNYAGAQKNKAASTIQRVAREHLTRKNISKQQNKAASTTQQIASEPHLTRETAYKDIVYTLLLQSCKSRDIKQAIEFANMILIHKI